MADLVTPSRGHGLVEILDRVLDKGLVIAGDIKINLANVELLTIQVRLLVCSIDKAEQIGLDWWRQDPSLSVGARRLTQENEELKEQVRLLEEKVAALATLSTAGEGRSRPAQTVRAKQNTGGTNAG